MADAALENEYEQIKPNRLIDPFPVGGFTVRDVLSWDDGKRWELIDGIPRMMSTPSIPHELMVDGLYFQIRLFLRGKDCKPFNSSTGVILFPERKKSEHQLVIPDIFVVCDREKIKEDNIYGSPDFIIEVLSKGTRGYDLGDKRDVYEEAGVKEYWAVDNKMVYRFHLVNGKYLEAKYERTPDLVIEPVVLPGCEIIFEGDFF